MTRDPNDRTLTPWSTLAHKAIMRSDRSNLQVAPGWVPTDERERLNAYYVRACYLQNRAAWLLDTTNPDDIDGHREYGDAALLVERLVAAILGDGWDLRVDGAADTPPPVPDLPARPDDDLPDGLPDGIAARIDAATTAAWEAAVEAAVEAWEAQVAARPALAARQADLDAWVDREHLRSAIAELEADSVGLGDGVIVLWPQAGGWPRVEVIDPGAYFPVVDEHDDGRFPRKVHLAWEYTDRQPDGSETRRLRRITFELVPIAATRVTDAGEWADENGEAAEVPVVVVGERYRVDDHGVGHVERLYPWDQPAEGEPDDDAWSSMTCLLSDGTWDLADVGDDAYALDETRGDWRHYRLDLQIDFLPVIHSPNTATGKVPWGRAAIDTIAQALDDLADADTSATSAAGYVAHPTIGMGGDRTVPDNAVVMPGRIFNGDLKALDLSKGLQVLGDRVEALQERAATNARVTPEALGRSTDTNLSGVALLLRLAPFSQVVSAARTVRAPKYALLGRMAQRLAQAQGPDVLPPGPTPTVRLAFGSFLPVDQAALVAMVADAVRARVMSTHTAVTMLVAAGVPVEDAEAEVDRIRADDTAGAKDVADATGSEQLAADRLGVDLPGRAGDLIVTLPDDGDDVDVDGGV